MQNRRITPQRVLANLNAKRFALQCKTPHSSATFSRSSRLVADSTSGGWVNVMTTLGRGFPNSPNPPPKNWAKKPAKSRHSRAISLWRKPSWCILLPPASDRSIHQGQTFFDVRPSLVYTVPPASGPSIHQEKPYTPRFGREFGLARITLCKHNPCLFSREDAWGGATQTQNETRIPDSNVKQTAAATPQRPTLSQQ